MGFLARPAEAFDGVDATGQVAGFGVSSPGALITVAGGKHLRVLLGTHGTGHDGPAVIPFGAGRAGPGRAGTCVP